MHAVLVGKAQLPVPVGDLMITDNKTCSRTICISESKLSMGPPDTSKFSDRTSDGYVRSDGKVGIANTGCSSVFFEKRNVDVIREVLDNEPGYTVSDKY